MLSLSESMSGEEIASRPSVAARRAATEGGYRGNRAGGPFWLSCLVEHDKDEGAHLHSVRGGGKGGRDFQWQRPTVAAILTSRVFA